MVSQVKPVFRNPELYQQLNYRDYIREHCPGPRDGLSVLDLDLVVLQFGKMVNRPGNADGKFALVEIKNKGITIQYAMGRFLRLAHKLLRQADPNQEHYIGAYLLEWDNDSNKPWAINKIPVDDNQFLNWITGKTYFRSLYDDEF